MQASETVLHRPGVVVARCRQTEAQMIRSPGFAPEIGVYLKRFLELLTCARSLCDRYFPYDGYFCFQLVFVSQVVSVKQFFPLHCIVHVFIILPFSIETCYQNFKIVIEIF